MFNCLNVSNQISEVQSYNKWMCVCVCACKCCSLQVWHTLHSLSLFVLYTTHHSGLHQYFAGLRSYSVQDWAAHTNNLGCVCVVEEARVHFLPLWPSFCGSRWEWWGGSWALDLCWTLQSLGCQSRRSNRCWWSCSRPNWRRQGHTEMVQVLFFFSSFGVFFF